MKTGFLIVELIIIVTILCIPPAIVVPQFRSQSGQAREAAVKDDPQILRQRIYLYAARHNGIPPGYPDWDTSAITF